MRIKKIRIVVVEMCSRCGKKQRWGRNIYCKRCFREVTAVNPRQK